MNTYYQLIASAIVLAVFGVGIWGVVSSFCNRRAPATPPVSEPRATYKEDLARLKREKHFIYYERNLLVALLAKAIAGEMAIAKSVGVGYDPHFGTWGTCLYIETTEIGQLCWHFHDSQRWMVDLVTHRNHDRPWDGRTKEDKYTAIEKWLHKQS